jgi:hypothetical protein
LTVAHLGATRLDHLHATICAVSSVSSRAAAEQQQQQQLQLQQQQKCQKHTSLGSMVEPAAVPQQPAAHRLVAADELGVLKGDCLD